MASLSTLEMLPDELLLEVCKYLLTIDVLQSFFGLNGRMTRLIRDYRHHVSLHKGSFAQCAYVYVNVLPKIGSHIRTLVIDRLYSVLQCDMFHHHFSHQKLSHLFPRLEKITLVAFRHETLLPFVSKLEDFEHLVQLNIRSLFSVPLEHQSTVLEALLTANNQRIRSVVISHCWTSLRLDSLPSVLYSNIINLQITIATFNDLSLLFSAIPNVCDLNVTLTDVDTFITFNDETSPLVHLTNFQLDSVKCPWTVDELVILLDRMPGVQYLSLHLLTYDAHLIDGECILILQQSISHVQQFNYAVYYIAEINNFDRETILASWPTSSIECLVHQTSNVDYIFAFIHTLLPCIEPYKSLEFPSTIIGKAMPAKVSDRQVEQLDIYDVSTFVGCLPVITRWRSAKEVMIWFSDTDPTAAAVTGQPQQQQISLFPKMARLKHVTLLGSVPSDLDHFSLVLTAASNLTRLDLNFDSLLPLLDNEETCCFFQRRIRALSIDKISSSSLTAIDEHHIPRIALAFPRVRHMFVDLTHVLPTIDSMVLCVLTEFKKSLVSLGADGPPSDEMKADARKWLEENNTNIIHPEEFDAHFNVQSNRLLVWM